jgi:phosphoribosyl-ATP pyrophosphohydrolase
MRDTLEELQQTILSRRSSPREGSYTVKLLSDPELVQRKIMEESFEVCLELGRGSVNPGDLAAEAADLLYHLLVGLASVDVTLDDVLSVLEQRR